MFAVTSYFIFSNSLVFVDAQYDEIRPCRNICLQRVFVRLDKISLEPLFAKLSEFNATVAPSMQLSSEQLGLLRSFFAAFHPRYLSLHFELLYDNLMAYYLFPAP